MAYYLTTGSELAAIADAIRTKGGTSDQLVFPDSFISAIQAIDTSGGSGEGQEAFAPDAVYNLEESRNLSGPTTQSGNPSQTTRSVTLNRAYIYLIRIRKNQKSGSLYSGLGTIWNRIYVYDGTQWKHADSGTLDTTNLGQVSLSGDSLTVKLFAGYNNYNQLAIMKIAQIRADETEQEE